MGGCVLRALKEETEVFSAQSEWQGLRGVTGGAWTKVRVQCLQVVLRKLVGSKAPKLASSSAGPPALMRLEETQNETEKKLVRYMRNARPARSGCLQSH